MEAIRFIQDFAIILIVAGVVGWVCQRMGMSTVVGYLVAGMVVGPHTPPMALVTDVPRVETLAQLGLVFLMFSIGLRLSLRKIRRLGFSLLFAVGVSAGLIFSGTRLFGVAVGLSSIESLFIAGMLMVSSSAIISKVLSESDATHERSGQLAMGVTVIEDVVAVVMLTVLNSIVQFGEAGRSARVGETLGLLGAFIVLAGVCGLLLVPWLLRRLSVTANEELQTLGLTGLLFGMALLAYKAGYSLALGSFLIGTIVAETPHRPQVERLFEGMRDVFSAVFFVAIGMQIVPSELWRASGWIIGLAIFTMVLRPLACATGLSLIGTPVRDALRAGAMVLPIGEFSFIIAQLGVGAGVVSQKFYPLAVGLSLVTTLVASPVTRHSETLIGMLLARQPRWVDDLLKAYNGWLARMEVRKRRNLLWQLSRKRVIQVGTGLLFVTGLFVFADRILDAVVGWFGKDALFPNGPEILFWIVLTLVALVPLVAIWRNIEAMALLYAEVTAKGHAHEERLKVFIEHVLQILAGAGLYVWLASILPVEGTARWILLMSGIVAVVAVLVLRRKLIYWHSEMEVEIQSIIEPEQQRMSATSAPWLQSHDDWNLAVVDCLVPDLADCQGKSIRELGVRSRFGCTVVGIERQGYMIPLPDAGQVLYPRDKVLLMGTPAQVREGTAFLTAVTGVYSADTHFEEVRMEALAVIAQSPAVGQAFGALSGERKFGVQIAGVHREGMRRLNPEADERIIVGDELLTLGTAGQLREFRAWLRGQS